MFKELLLYLLLLIVMYSVGTHHVIAAEPEDQITQYSSNQINMFIAYTHKETATGTSTIAEIMLSTHNIPLNAFSAELLVDSDEITISGILIHESLCKRQFVIEQTIDNETGVARVTCGSSIPFVTGVKYLPILSLHLESHGDKVPVVNLGDKTGFHIHDGYGTKAVTRLVPEPQEV